MGRRCSRAAPLRQAADQSAGKPVLDADAVELEHVPRRRGGLVRLGWREKIGQSLDHRGFDVGPAEDADVIGTDFARAQRANDAAAGAGVFKKPRGRPDKEIDVIEHAQNEQPGPRGFIMSPPGGKPRPTAQRRAGCQPIPSIGARL